MNFNRILNHWQFRQWSIHPVHFFILRENSLSLKPWVVYCLYMAKLITGYMLWLKSTDEYIYIYMNMSILHLCKCSLALSMSPEIVMEGDHPRSIVSQLVEFGI